MAVAVTDRIDPTEDPLIDELKPRALSIEAIDFSVVVVSYDRDSDTLFVHLFGRGRPSISMVAGDDSYVLVDPDTEEIVGFQIEHVLTSVEQRDHALLALLDVADLRGIGKDDIEEIRREMLGSDRRSSFSLGQHPGDTRSQKRREIILKLLDEQDILGAALASVA